MKLTFIRSEAVAKGIRSFFFEPEHSVHYTPGQYTKLYLPHEQMDARGDSRWFTLSSSPTEKLWSITIKLDPSRSSSFKQHLQKLIPGAVIRADEPLGDFVLPQDSNRPLLFVAGGIGVTPYRSMVKWLSDKKLRRNIRLIYAAAKSQEFAFIELFHEYGVELVPVATEPPTSWKGETGHLDVHRILQLSPDIKDRLVYLAGPEPMVEQFFDGLTSNSVGIPKNQVVTDYFPNYPSF